MSYATLELLSSDKMLIPLNLRIVNIAIAR